jgi:hypothetical protein
MKIWRRTDKINDSVPRDTWNGRVLRAHGSDVASDPIPTTLCFPSCPVNNSAIDLPSVPLFVETKD